MQYFGLDSEISSPTFTIVNEYESNQITIYHFDLYRLEDLDEFYAMGGEEYFSKGLCIMEWGTMVEPILSKPYTKIEFSKNPIEEDLRILTLSEGEIK